MPNDAGDSAARISEQELMEFLKAVEEGAISLRPEADPQDIYAGNVPYAASNGWQIAIFNDCNEWDYIDGVETSDGRRLRFDDIDGFMPIAREYVPEDDVAWRRYGIPGYCTFRCTSCSNVLEDRELRRPPFRCGLCVAKVKK
ncbi:MAG TPA: hypothetical protein VNW97_16385 [Candidatus Saccharimonadales bacterium]|nr:hypothetical protein [Candidatus Saccharimonadales bacterium]